MDKGKHHFPNTQRNIQTLKNKQFKQKRKKNKQTKQEKKSNIKWKKERNNDTKKKKKKQHLLHVDRVVHIRVCSTQVVYYL